MDAETGELRRKRLGGGVDEVVGFLASQQGPVPAVYEAGPTGFGLARAGAAAGVEIILVAPGKTPRAASDRVKTDQRDAELLVRLLMAGSLRAIHVPSVSQEAARCAPAIASPSCSCATGASAERSWHVDGRPS